jgi:hypothetical protein
MFLLHQLTPERVALVPNALQLAPEVVRVVSRADELPLDILDVRSGQQRRLAAVFGGQFPQHCFVVNH